MNKDFDFGFTAVDEDELEAVQQTQASAENVKARASKLEGKVDKLYTAITPLLANLKKNPEKEYIYWPNRTIKIEQFENIITKIINE